MILKNEGFFCKRYSIKIIVAGKTGDPSCLGKMEDLNSGGIYPHKLSLEFI